MGMVSFDLDCCNILGEMTLNQIKAARCQTQYAVTTTRIAGLYLLKLLRQSDGFKHVFTNLVHMDSPVILQTVDATRVNCTFRFMRKQSRRLSRTSAASYVRVVDPNGMLMDPNLFVS
jgi:hypothetical protein